MRCYQHDHIYHTLGRSTGPSAHPDPLCSTRLLVTRTHQGCGSSSLQLHDYRQENQYQYIRRLEYEVRLLSMSDTEFQ